MWSNNQLSKNRLSKIIHLQKKNDFRSLILVLTDNRFYSDLLVDKLFHCTNNRLITYLMSHLTSRSLDSPINRIYGKIVI